MTWLRRERTLNTSCHWKRKYITRLFICPSCWLLVNISATWNANWLHKCSSSIWMLLRLTLWDIPSENKIKRSYEFFEWIELETGLWRTRLDLCRIAMLITEEYLGQFSIKGCVRMSVTNTAWCTKYSYRESSKVFFALHTITTPDTIEKGFYSEFLELDWT